MNKRDSSIAYLILGIMLILAYIFWPLYLIYELLTGGLSHDMWKTIPLSYFK
jgi:hypothetical protein